MLQNVAETLDGGKGALGDEAVLRCSIPASLFRELFYDGGGPRESTDALLILHEVKCGQFWARKKDGAGFGVSGLQESAVDGGTVGPIQRGLLLNVELWKRSHHAEILRTLMCGPQKFCSTEKSNVVGLLKEGHQLVDVIDWRYESLGSVLRRDDDIKTTVGLGDDASLACTIEIVPYQLGVEIGEGLNHVFCREGGQALNLPLMYPVSYGHFLKICANIIKI